MTVEYAIYNHHRIMMCRYTTPSCFHQFKSGNAALIKGFVLSNMFSLLDFVALLATVLVIDALIPDKLRHIPTVGPSGRLTSIFGAIHHVFRSKELINKGYTKASQRTMSCHTMQGANSSYRVNSQCRGC
ncbi:hypothetical protein C8Q75DRAFT_506643 [Abortiporus biennis]|nr:hypothetical protein C8Q75DRAFT_506643 [Abortiporus biennis]